MIHWADLLMISGGVFSFILFLGSLLERKKKQIQWAIAWVYLCHSAIVINKGLACSGMVSLAPWTMHLDLLFFYFIGPVLYYYLRSFSDRNFRLRKIDFLHFLPALGLIILYVPFLRQNLSWKLDHFPFYMNQATLQGKWIYGASYLIPSFFVLIYVLRGLRFFPKIKEIYRNLPAFIVWIIAFLAVETILFAGLMVWAYFNWSWNIYRVIMNGLNQIIISYFLLTKRFPHLFDHLKEEIRKNQGLIHLKAEEIPKLTERLCCAMETDKVFKDPELNLQGLGSILHLSGHQLSELVNRSQGISFRKYLNSYRLKEACLLLKQSKDLSILEVAFQAGFRSKTAFNTLFKKEIRRTPREFREEP